LTTSFLPKLTPLQKSVFKRLDTWGEKSSHKFIWVDVLSLPVYSNYALSTEGACHRTQVAVRTQTLGEEAWDRFVAGEEIGDEQDQARADHFMESMVLQVYHKETVEVLARFERTADALPSGPRPMLTQRWKQIHTITYDAVKNGISVPVDGYA